MKKTSRFRILILCILLLGLSLNSVAYAEYRPIFIQQEKSLQSYRACYAMMITNLMNLGEIPVQKAGINDIPANGKQQVADGTGGKLEKKFGITVLSSDNKAKEGADEIEKKYKLTYRTGTPSDKKIDIIKTLLKTHPQGVGVIFAKGNSSHMIVAIGADDNGNLRFNDPIGPNSAEKSENIIFDKSWCKMGLDFGWENSTGLQIVEAKELPQSNDIFSEKHVKKLNGKSYNGSSLTGKTRSQAESYVTKVFGKPLGKEEISFANSANKLELYDVIETRLNYNFGSVVFVNEASDYKSDGWKTSGLMTSYIDVKTNKFEGPNGIRVGDSVEKLTRSFRFQPNNYPYEHNTRFIYDTRDDGMKNAIGWAYMDATDAKNASQIVYRYRILTKNYTDRFIIFYVNIDNRKIKDYQIEFYGQFSISG